LISGAIHTLSFCQTGGIRNYIIPPGEQKSAGNPKKRENIEIRGVFYLNWSQKPEESLADPKREPWN
jgi:hypothetical protein